MNIEFTGMVSEYTVLNYVVTNFNYIPNFTLYDLTINKNPVWKTVAPTIHGSNYLYLYFDKTNRWVVNSFKFMWSEHIKKDLLGEEEPMNSLRSLEINDPNNALTKLFSINWQTHQVIRDEWSFQKNIKLEQLS